MLEFDKAFGICKIFSAIDETWHNGKEHGKASIHKIATNIKRMAAYEDTS